MVFALSCYKLPYVRTLCLLRFKSQESCEPVTLHDLSDGAPVMGHDCLEQNGAFLDDMYQRLE